MNDVILIDAGTGNLRSVQKALESIGANVLRTDDPQKGVNCKAGCVARCWRIWRFYVRFAGARIGICDQ